MKAPDKIYIDDLAVVNDCVTKISLEQLPNFSEYIRKDTLIEWLEKRLHEVGLAGMIHIIDVIDKLNSM